MRSKSNSNKTRLIKTGVLVLLLVAIAVPAVNLIRTSNDQEGTVLFLSDELVYLDGLDEPLEYAAAVQKPNESAMILSISLYTFSSRNLSNYLP